MNPIDPYTQRERGPSPGLALLRTIGRAAKRCRPGFGTKEALIFAAVGAAVVVVLGGGFLLFRAIFGGSEEQVLKSNIDRVVQSSERYWNEFSSDRHGRRGIDIGEFCEFANSEFAVSGDLSIRTVAIAGAAAGTGSPGDTSGIAGGMATHVAVQTAIDAAEGGCPLHGSVIQLGVDFPDIIISNAVLVPANQGAAGVWPERALAVTSGSGLQPAEADDLVTAGLMSTRTVWMAQFDFAVATDVPAGAREVDNSADNDVLVFGGVAPSGRAFCVIKVFSASDRSEVAEYRVSREASNGAATPLAVCTDGVDVTTGGNTPRVNSGWPDAR